MSNHTNTIDFLTSPENLTPTLEILQHAEAIQAKTLSLFWTALADRLHSTLPAALNAETMFWDESDKVPTKATGQYAGIALHLGGSQTHAQELNFRIEQSNEAKYFELYFGLHWKKEVTEAKMMATKQPDVLALRAFQEANGFLFDNNSWWWGWKYLRGRLPAQRVPAGVQSLARDRHGDCCHILVVGRIGI